LAATLRKYSRAGPYIKIIWYRQYLQCAECSEFKVSAVPLPAQPQIICPLLIGYKKLTNETVVIQLAF